MASELPGTRLFRVLARVVSEERFRDSIVPTLADLQHEALLAGANRRLRWTACIRGYVAVLRLLADPYPSWRSKMRGVLTVGGLGLAASAAMILTGVRPPEDYGQVADRQILMLGILALCALTLRALHLASSFRRALLSCLGIAVMMVFARILWFVSHDTAWAALLRLGWNPGIRPVDVILRLVYGSIGIAVPASIVAACAIWRPAHPMSGDTTERLRGWVLAAAAGAAAYALTAGVIGGVRLGSGLEDVVDRVAMSVAPSGLFFLASGLAVYVPVVLIARRFIGHPAWMAAVGALLFPVMMLIEPLGPFPSLAVLVSVPLIAITRRFTARPAWVAAAGAVPVALTMSIYLHVHGWRVSPLWTLNLWRSGQAILFFAPPYAIGGAVLAWRLATLERWGSGSGARDACVA